MKFMATVIPLVEFDNAPWSYSMSIDHIISGIYNSRIWEVILIDDSATLLDFKHQFMGSLYVVDNVDILDLSNISNNIFF